MNRNSNSPSSKSARLFRGVAVCLVLLAGTLAASAADAQTASLQTVPPPPATAALEESESNQAGLQDLVDLDQLTQPEKISGTVKTVALLAILSLAPAIALMTTSFVRIMIVLSILRQAIGAQQIPSAQIITALSLFMSFLIMTPVWNEVKTEAFDPYTNSSGSEMTFSEAWQAGARPIKRFMSRQIDLAGNVNDIWLFYGHLPESARSQPPETFDDIPIQVLLPAFMISELKIAFLIGFQIFMPFLVLDLVVTSVTTSMGMVMLPPTMISLPLKLILFVLADGWNLVVGMLMQSFTPAL